MLLRVDFNVPLEGARIADDSRIRASLPTIRELVERGASIIIATHLGRPGGTVVEHLRVEPLAARLSQLLGKLVDAYLSSAAKVDRPAYGSIRHSRE